MPAGVDKFFGPRCSSMSAYHQTLERIPVTSPVPLRGVAVLQLLNQRILTALRYVLHETISIDGRFVSLEISPGCTVTISRLRSTDLQVQLNLAVKEPLCCGRISLRNICCGTVTSSEATSICFTSLRS